MTVVTVTGSFINCDAQLIVHLEVNSGCHRRSFINYDAELIVLLEINEQGLDKGSMPGSSRPSIESYTLT